MVRFSTLFVVLAVVASVFASQQLLSVHSPGIAIAGEWEVLGPFQSGTREQQWGADPLEHYGGFRNIKYSPQAFSSTLNGSVYFQHINASPLTITNDLVSRIIPVTFPDVNWESLQSVFGWSALQFQAWIRGKVHLSRSGRYGFWIDGAVEFYLDGVYYDTGNLYESDIATYFRGGVFLDLEEGEHLFEIRVVSDIRAFGGQIPPNVEVHLSMRKVGEILVVADYDSYGGWIVPSVLKVKRGNGKSEGCLAGEWGSLAVRNEGSERILITDIQLNEGPSQITEPDEQIYIFPGQQRPIPIYLTGISNPSILSVKLTYHFTNTTTTKHTKTFTHSLPIITDIFQPHQFTHIHPSGLITSSTIIPPKSIKSGYPAYILLALHGAGVDNNSPFWSNAYANLSNLNAFVVQPSGVTPWGDDWHGAWSFADAESAREGVVKWSHCMRSCVDYKFWFWVPTIITGHSNGGQGVWYALTHWSDVNIRAGNPVSGYSSITNYVPYNLWTGLDAEKKLIRDIALRSYEHGLLAENVVPFPLFVRHSRDDDNVPVWHSRYLVDQVKSDGGDIQFEEVSGTGHWYDGIMAEGLIGEYLSDVSSRAPFTTPVTKSFVVANPREMGPRGGIKVEQLISWKRLGRVGVRRESILSPLPIEVIYLNTTNVRRFTVMNPYQIDVMHIDGQYIPCGECLCISLLRDDETGKWRNENFCGIHPEESSKVWGVQERHGQQLGPMAAIMDTPGPLTIVIGTQRPETIVQMERIASNIAQNLFIYFSAEVDIRYDHEMNKANPTGNIIALGMEDESSYVQQLTLLSPVLRGFPIQARNRTITVSETNRQHIYTGEDIGTIYLRPFPQTRLLLTISGTTQKGLELASRLFPYKSGAGQPDWIIVGPEMGVQGMQGVKAMGYYNNLWEIESDVSYFS